MGNLIMMENNEIFTTSRLIAETFEKKHRNVVQSIVKLSGEINLLNFQQISKTPYFSPHEYIDSKGRTYTEYRVSRNGFVLLAMGFTGAKALEWKIRYIEAFNLMEERLVSVPSPDNRIEIARLIVGTSDHKIKAIRELYPEYFTAVTRSRAVEHPNDTELSYDKWLDDCEIDLDWIEYFSTTEIYYNYARYCAENRLQDMGKKTFFRKLMQDFNLVRKQKKNGLRYFQRVR